MRRHARLDLQAKISLVLVAVILPTFLIVTVAENKLTQPMLEEEMRQVGIVTAKTVASDIVSRRLLNLANPTPSIETSLQELIYSQPNIQRISVYSRDAQTGGAKFIASTVEEDPPTQSLPLPLAEVLTTEFKTDEFGTGQWEVHAPIEMRSRDGKSQRKFLGTVQVVVSMKTINRILAALWRTTASAAAISVVALIFALSYFLRKTIANDRKLRRAENENFQLTQQLHEAQRELMNTEKLAVMGQLTASFAHEIGTPLNAMSGHLQLLREELGPACSGAGATDRMEIIAGQVAKIEQIVQGFLQNTAKPASQKQLTDLNRLVDQTLGIVAPRMESLGIESRRDLDRSLGPVRVVPLELEQILLNLVNNSLDSIQSKRGDRGKRVLGISTRPESKESRDWAVIEVYDSGEGIPKLDLPNVLKPFFTTKRPGEGTGLGLTICLQLANKYGAQLEIDSKEGSWTKVTLWMPYQVNS